MRPRLLTRPALLFLAAFCWLLLPGKVLGQRGGGHAGGGHTGGGHVSGSSGHTGSYASTSVGRGPTASAGHATGAVGMPRGGYSGPYASASSAVPVRGAQGSLSSFVPSSSFSAQHGPVADATLAQMAAHGWMFTPSSRIVRPTDALRTPARAVIPPAARAVPVVNPPHRPFLRPRPPFGFTRPGFGFRGCFFNGFTTVCGGGLFFNPWWWGGGCWNGNWGLGYYGWPYYGLGYGYYGGGYPPYTDFNADEDSVRNSGRMDIYGGYIGDLPPDSGTETSVPATPPTLIILKNGSAFAVNSYWVSDGELYYRPVTGGLNHVPLGQLDLAATVEANSAKGVPFTLSVQPPQS